jgi:hypothetical protein
MKKLLAAVLCVLFAATSSFALSVIPKIGVDIPGTMDYDIGADAETRTGCNVGVEARGSISSYFAWGAGVEYNVPRGLKRNYEKPGDVDISGENDFSFMPVYISLLFYPFGDYKARPYVKANVGYSVLASNDKGSDMTGAIYWGAGVGAEYKNFVGEMSVSTYEGEYKDIETIGLRYRKIGFTLGYKFDIKLGSSQYEEE